MDLDIEQDSDGNIIAVWLGCQALPFAIHKVDDERAQALRVMYKINDFGTATIKTITLKDIVDIEITKKRV